MQINDAVFLTQAIYEKLQPLRSPRIAGYLMKNVWFFIGNSEFFGRPCIVSLFLIQFWSVQHSLFQPC